MGSTPESIDEWEGRLSKAIRRRGLSVSLHDFLAVLSDVAERSEPLTHSDREFLISYTDLSDEDLTEESADSADIEIVANRSAAAQDMRTRSIDTQPLAALLKVTPATVRRAAREGTLYSIKTPPSGHRLFPTWQFHHGRAMPGLRAVMGALPHSYHPLEIEAFMTERSQELRGMSPAMWLAEDGNVDDVVAVADEAAWD